MLCVRCECRSQTNSSTKRLNRSSRRRILQLSRIFFTEWTDDQWWMKNLNEKKKNTNFLSLILFAYEKYKIANFFHASAQKRRRRTLPCLLPHPIILCIAMRMRAQLQRSQWLYKEQQHTLPIRVCVYCTQRTRSLTEVDDNTEEVVVVAAAAAAMTGCDDDDKVCDIFVNGDGAAVTLDDDFLLLAEELLLGNTSISIKKKTRHNIMSSSSSQPPGGRTRTVCDGHFLFPFFSYSRFYSISLGGLLFHRRWTYLCEWWIHFCGGHLGGGNFSGDVRLIGVVPLCTSLLAG